MSPGLPKTLAVSNCPDLGGIVTLDSTRALERMGGETSQLALARYVMRGVLGRERSRGRTVEKWRVKTKFFSTYKVQLRMNGKTFFVAVW